MNRVFVADLPAAQATAVGDATLVGADVPGDVPSKPFGDSSEYAWAPDGKSLVLSARKSDRTEPWSTNFDLYQVSADGSGAAGNLPEPTRPGNRARLSPATAKRRTTPGWGPRASRPNGSRLMPWTRAPGDRESTRLKSRHQTATSI